MRDRFEHYAFAFALVLIAGAIGAWLSLRWLAPKELDASALPLSAEGIDRSLNLVGTVLARTAPEPADRATPTPEPIEPTSPTPTPKSSAVEIPSPVTPTPIPTTAEPSEPATSAAQPTRPPSPTPTPTTPPPTPTPAFEFIPAGPVRHTTEGCAGQAIRGTIYDAAGNPLPGVRVWLYDQWANESHATSKAGATDLGQYDFPIFINAPAMFYVTILGADGAPVSPTIEVPHHQGAAGNAPCHWLDWRRTR
ncbi:MAG: hypothetical protein Kow0047_24850 [Anaerolineae bacterium]